MRRSIPRIALALTPWLLASGAPAAPDALQPSAAASAPDRRALRDPDPARRLAAVHACEIAWDHGALPLLREREGDADARVRRAARRLLRRFYVWGPERPDWRDRERANQPGFAPHDRAGLRAWRRRGAHPTLPRVPSAGAPAGSGVSPPARAPAAGWP